MLLQIHVGVSFTTRSSANTAAVAEILNGEPKYFRAFLAERHDHFSSGCGFLVGFDKHKLYTKFEVSSFSHCVNIEGNP